MRAALFFKHVTPKLPITRPDIARLVIMEYLGIEYRNGKPAGYVGLARKISKKMNGRKLRIPLDKEKAKKILVFFANKIYE